MAIQLSTTLRNARLDQIETTVGTAAILRVYSGSAPANVAASITGTLLAEATLPSDWMAAASNGSKALSGTWSDTSVNATGTASHFRIWASDGTTAHIQGTVTASGGGGDMIVDSTSFVSGTTFTVTSFTLTDGNA